MISSNLEIPPQLSEALRHLPVVTILTGAGISAESGLPTFREAQTGLWANFRPEDLATPEAFQRDPQLVWEWYAWRRHFVGSAQPNAGHLALVEMEKHLPGFTLITQNVDGLHQRAGSRDVIELHGSIQRTRCFKMDHQVEDWEEAGDIPPRCPTCGSYLRPDVVWFGEMLPSQALSAAQRAARDCQIFFSIGTSGLVEPAASLAFSALRSGALVIEVNPDPTPLTPHAAHFLQGPAGEVLPRLIQFLG